jgi:hypothetical protein
VTDPIRPPPATVEYWVISLFSSRTFWFNAANLVLAALSLTEVVTLIPVRFLSLQAAVVALINMWLRSITVRPAVLILPGQTVPVPVARVGPPPPPVLSD